MIINKDVLEFDVEKDSEIILSKIKKKKDYPFILKSV